MSDISMYRKLLGYNGGDKKYPIYAAMPGALVTHAFIHCTNCREAISHNMGPRSDAWCVECTEEKIIADAKAKVKAKEEKDKLAKIKAALAKKKEEDELAKRIADETKDA